MSGLPVEIVEMLGQTIAKVVPVTIRWRCCSRC